MNKILGCLFAMLIVLCFMTNPAHAVSIDFSGGYGGTVSYAGGVNPLVGSGDVINLVFGIPGGSAVVTSGSLDYTTGNLSSSTGSGGSFTDIFSPGGSLTITGSVPSVPVGPTTLLSGSFSGSPTFTCCSAGNATFSTLLTDLTVDPTLASYFGFVPPASGAALAQAELFITFTGGVPGPGLGFTGSQASVNLVVSPVPVPEPASLLLLGSGLAGLGLWGRKRLKGA